MVSTEIIRACLSVCAGIAIVVVILLAPIAIGNWYKQYKMWTTPSDVGGVK